MILYSIFFNDSMITFIEALALASSQKLHTASDRAIRWVIIRRTKMVTSLIYLTDGYLSTEERV
jgi:hypothetical protein